MFQPSYPKQVHSPLRSIDHKTENNFYWRNISLLKLNMKQEQRVAVDAIACKNHKFINNFAVFCVERWSIQLQEKMVYLKCLKQGTYFLYCVLKVETAWLLKIQIKSYLSIVFFKAVFFVIKLLFICVILLSSKASNVTLLL